MLESFTTDVFEYQRLSPEEQEKRGILGRLAGVIADTKEATRNGRSYSAELWEKVFENPLMEEKISTRCCLGELGHPTDRTDIDIEKVALCLAEKPKKGKDGKLYGVFDILSTPNGRILKSLCDYGCRIGVSSRGEGDLITGFDGNEEVDPDTYSCECWDAVLIPAVKDARPAYVTEALDKKRYNKTLREKLQESINKESIDNKKVIKESLNTLGISLNEDEEYVNIDVPVDDVEQEKEFVTLSMNNNGAYSVSDGEAGENSFTMPAEAYNDIMNDINAEVDFDDIDDDMYYDIVEDASDEDGESFEESLSSVNESVINEDDLHPVFRKDAKNQYKTFSAKKARYDAKADKLEKDLKDLGETDPEKVNYYKDIVIGDEPVFKYRKGNNSLERQNHPFYITVYEGTSYYHPEEGGYYQAGLEPYYSEGYETFEEAQEALKNYLEENSSATVAFNPSNVAVDDDNYSYSESEEEYKPVYDSKDRLIGATASGKYIGEEEQVWIEPNKHYLSRQRGYEMYESLNESKESSELANVIYDTLMNNKQFDQFDVDKVENPEIDVQKDAITFTYDGKPYKLSVLEIGETENTAVDNNEAMVEEFQNLILENHKLLKEVADLQEKLSVCYTKENKLSESVTTEKSKVVKLSEELKKAQASSRKLEKATSNLKELSESTNSYKERAVKLQEKLSTTIEKHNNLAEKYNSMRKERDELKSSISALNESVASLKKDSDMKRVEFSDKLKESKSLVEKYKGIAKKAVNKYISSQAIRLGVTSNEIKNKLSENYTFEEIDNVCSEIQQYQLNMSKLPFTSTLNESVVLKGASSKSETIAPLNNGNSDDVDSSLLYLAQLR